MRHPGVGRSPRLPKAALPDGCPVGVLVGVGEVTESVGDALPRLLFSELDALAKDPSRDPDLRLAAWEELQARANYEVEWGDSGRGGSRDV
jgi:hypothetical protein